MIVSTGSSCARLERDGASAGQGLAGRERAFGWTVYGPGSLRVMTIGLISLTLAGCASTSFWPGGSGGTTTEMTDQQPSSSFAAFVEGLRPEAAARGVSRKTFDAAFAGVSPDPKIIALTKKQAEFSKPIWDYVASAVSDKKLERGRQLTTDWGSTLAQVETVYGVDRKVVAGVWGMETNFGGNMGNNYVVRALSTLAYERYRGDYFRNELLTALQILEQGHVAPADMIGSWAGAMGQTQFMPSSFMRYAVDFEGNGKRDIWTSVPDALASTANYLKLHGWQAGLPWGFEVRVPQGFAFGAQRKSFAAWRAAGVRRMDGRPMPAEGEARLFLPAGANGPVFLVTGNFDVIKRYNNSDAYALGVAHLGDRLFGGAPIQTPWPADEPLLSHNQRQEMQRKLSARGFDVGEPDGRIGSQTRQAILAYQEQHGLVADGYPTVALLDHMRRTQ